MVWNICRPVIGLLVLKRENRQLLWAHDEGVRVCQVILQDFDLHGRLNDLVKELKRTAKAQILETDMQLHFCR